VAIKAEDADVLEFVLVELAVDLYRESALKAALLGDLASLLH
jgi:hypothetical protein